MEKLIQILSHSYLKLGLSTPQQRRSELIDNMAKLEQQKKHCFSCSGMCCTFEYNSMQVTPIEALELLAYLDSENRVDENLITQLKENIQKFRLDKDFNLGKGRELRRYYTCPFFMNQSKGCSISRKDKPYGCLAFNPYEQNVSESGSCTSDLSLLERRDLDYRVQEKSANSFVAESLSLDWSKKNISSALLDILNKILPNQ